MILLSMLLAAAAVQDAPMPREAHVFHDWVVACDNGRRCQAVGLVPEGEFEGYNGVLAIERGPESEAPLTMRLVQYDEGRPARLTVYGQPLPVRLSEADGDVLIEIQDRPAFMERIYSEPITIEDASGAAIGKLSIRGLTGAMLYMDEVQGRLHTTTALIRTGRRPASEMPPAPPVPTIRLAPPTREAPLAIPPARIAQLRRDVGCTIGDVGGPDTAITGALGGGRTLVILGCGSGAYNYSGVPFIAMREGRTIRIDPAPFDIPLSEWEVEEGNRTLVNPAWDADTMVMDDFSKGRGLGDCGTRSRYGWDGAQFRLIHREEMPECRGSIVYVTTWRAETAR